MVHIIEGVLPALLFLAGFDLCFLDGEYTYWVLVSSGLRHSLIRLFGLRNPRFVGRPFAPSCASPGRPNLNFHASLNETKFALARWALSDMEVSHVDCRFCHNYCYFHRLRRDGHCHRVPPDSGGCLYVYGIIESVG